MKINVIGYSGSGKSTLTKFLAEYYDIPYLYLDTVQFLDNWQERDRQEAVTLIENFITTYSDYVLDGNYHQFHYDRRMADADKIIFLNFNRWSCFFRAFKRYLTYRGKTRESSSENCIEKFDFEFISWILWSGRTNQIKAQYQALKKQYPNKLIEIKNQKQLTQFMKNFQ